MGLRIRLYLSAVVATACLLLPTEGKASDELNETALSIAPADAAFFSTSVNLDEAWQELAEGDLVTRLRSVPYIQQLEAEFWRQWENPNPQMQQAKAMLQNPNVKNLLKLGQDMFSDEVFVYGGDDWCDMVEGLMAFQYRISSTASQGPEAMQEMFNTLTKADVDELRIPTTVVGFRLSDDENARLQLDALEGLLRLGGGQIPEAQPFLKNLKRSNLSDGQTLTLKLDTSLIPLEAIGEDARPAAEKAIELLEGREISIAIGVKNNMLLLAVGEGDATINSVGDTTEPLLQHERLAVLRDAAPERLRAVNYVSQRFRRSQWEANFSRYFTNITNQIQLAVSAEKNSDVDIGDWVAEMEQDAQYLDSKMAALTENFGATLAWNVATDGGAAGYGYDWSKNTFFENAAPLEILQHAGGKPLLMLAIKQAESAAGEEMIEYMLDKAPGHIGRFIALAEEDPEDREQAQQVLDRAWPLVLDGYAILRDQIAPSLRVNESVFSMAGQWSTTTLGPGAPPPPAPLPIPELAIACGVSDRALFLQGGEAFYDLADRVVDLVRELNPGDIPEGYRVPRPEEESVGGGKRYSYAEYTQAVPLDGFLPQLMLTDDLLVLGYSDRQVGDMLNAKPSGTGPAWLTPQTPVAAVSYIDFAAMVRMIRPWISYGLGFANPDPNAPIAPGNGPIPSGNDLLQIWDCFASLGKAAGTVSKTDEGYSFTRWVWVQK